jgi:agmatinase
VIRRPTSPSNLFGTYNYEMGVDLREQLNMVDIGDVFTIPGNLEKSFDQISQAMSHVIQQGVVPVVLGGDHSIGFPTIRGLAPHLDGNVGIIHFDSGWTDANAKAVEGHYRCCRHRRA